MKILLFTEIYDCGGIDTFIVNLINSWPDKSDSFVIIANSNYPGLQIIEEKATRPCEVIRHKVLLYSDLLLSNTFSKLLKKCLSPALRYVLVVHNILAFRKLLRQTNADKMMVINGGYPGGDSCRAAGVAWGLFSGKSQSIHNFHNLAVGAPCYLWLQEYLVDAALSAFTASFVTVSHAAAESMRSRPVIYAKRMTSYIHNGIEFQPVQPVSGKTVRDEIGVSPETPLCLMLATYEPRKGHSFLFKAFKKVLAEVPGTHLLVCGFGFPHEIEKVRQYVKEAQLENSVHLMEFRRDLPQLLSNADLLLVASQAYESFGLTSVEAMSQHTPVVATNVGGIPEVVVDGDGGYCVGREDVAEYAAKIIELLRDSRLRAEQGQKGYERAQRLFTAKLMAEKYHKLINS